MVVPGAGDDALGDGAAGCAALPGAPATPLRSAHLGAGVADRSEAVRRLIFGERLLCQGTEIAGDRGVRLEACAREYPLKGRDISSGRAEREHAGEGDVRLRRQSCRRGACSFRRNQRREFGFKPGDERLKRRDRRRGRCRSRRGDARCGRDRKGAQCKRSNREYDPVTGKHTP